jgi:excisionase family DNA binding protein
VNLTGDDDDIRAAFRCVSELLDRRRLQSGVGIPAWLTRHYARMRAAHLQLAVVGQENGAPDVFLGDEPPINTTQAAVMLNLSERTVRRKAKSGEIGADQVGRYWMFTRESVEWYARERQEL